MIPLRLELTNFLSYAAMPEPLDLSGVSLACLSGPNGHGKSALLDAITWALWGKARGSEGGHDQERLIRDGADAMGVEFVFSLDDQTYRVARSRTKSGKADITFNVEAADGSWTDLAGEGIADTQRRIVDRLRMDYETFVASAFILQGRADTFTTLDPRQRKDVLAKILGLEVYERLADRAREKKKEAQADADAHTRAIETLEADLVGKDELERLKAGAAEDLSGAEQRRAAADAQLKTLGERAKELHGVEAVATEAEKRRSEAADALHAEDAERRRLEARAAELAAESHVDEADRAAAGRVPDLEREDARFEERRTRQDQLVAEVAALERRLGEERSGLDAHRAAYDRTAARLEEDLAAEEESRELLARAQADFASLEGVSAERETLLARHAAIRERLAGIEAERSARQQEAAEIAEKLALLDGKSAGCPLCGQDLTAAHRKEVKASFTERTRRLAVLERDAAKETRRLTAEARQVEKDGAALKKSLDRRETISAQAATLTERLEQFRALRDDLDVAVRESKTIAERIASEDYGQPERDKLARVREEIAAVGFDAAAFRELKTMLDRSRKAERDVAAAAAAKAELEACRREATSAAGRGARATRILAQAEADLNAMGERLAALPALLEEMAVGERARDEAQRAVEEAGRVLAASTQALEVLERKVAQAADAKAARAVAKKTASLFDKLSKAFGRDGIPARIIGNAIPQLGAEANRLLGLLSDGQMTISIDPIRETKAKTLKETLEISVYDSASGKRAYEMYSGGERLRIDFALRVALSHLLATRAGTQLETLVIDEGFGSQDAEGRMRLLEAILRVRSEFRTVLVVTHIDDLKEYFPVRIEVRKDPQAGSRVTVI